MNCCFFEGRSIAAFLINGSKKYTKLGQGVDLAGTGFGNAEVDCEEEEKKKEQLHKYVEWMEQDKEQSSAFCCCTWSLCESPAFSRAFLCGVLDNNKLASSALPFLCADLDASNWSHR